jgi:type IV pilus assembly protein PilA
MMDNTMQNQKGLTVIELMAVVAIISILSVIALSVYGDFVVRSKVGEGLAFASEAKTSVSDYYYTNRTMPQDNTQAGLPDGDEYDEYNFIRRLEISSQPAAGTITITFKIPGTKADNKLLQLVPSTTDGTILWDCIPAATDGLETNHVPPNCRG